MKPFLVRFTRAQRQAQLLELLRAEQAKRAMLFEQLDHKLLPEFEDRMFRHIDRERVRILRQHGMTAAQIAQLFGLDLRFVIDQCDRIDAERGAPPSPFHIEA